MSIVSTVAKKSAVRLEQQAAAMRAVRTAVKEGVEVGLPKSIERSPALAEKVVQVVSVDEIRFTAGKLRGQATKMSHIDGKPVAGVRVYFEAAYDAVSESLSHFRQMVVAMGNRKLK